MKENSTLDLSRGLMCESNLDAYLSRNQSVFCDEDVIIFLNQLYQRTDLSKAALARQAGMSEVYLHQVFSGRRRPSRDRLLCLCICMGASLEEIQQALKHATYAPLYPKHKRDAIISHGILHGTGAAPVLNGRELQNPPTKQRSRSLWIGSGIFCVLRGITSAACRPGRRCPPSPPASGRRHGWDRR